MGHAVCMHCKENYCKCPARLSDGCWEEHDGIEHCDGGLLDKKLSPLNQEKQRIVNSYDNFEEQPILRTHEDRKWFLKNALDTLHAAVVREDRRKIRAIPHSEKCSKNSWEKQKAICICGTSEVIDRASEAIAPNKDKEE